MFPLENECKSLLPQNAHGSPNFDKAACTNIFITKAWLKQGNSVTSQRKDVHEVLVNRLGLCLPRKSVVRLTDCLDIRRDVDLDVKPQTTTTTTTVVTKPLTQ